MSIEPPEIGSIILQTVVSEKIPEMISKREIEQILSLSGKPSSFGRANR